MKFLITAGGTTEKIDEVRAITNKSTGQLGKLIAESLSYNCPSAEIFFLCADTVEIPCIKNLTIIKIKSVADTENAMLDLFARIQFDIIVHAMAISDYTVSNITCAENISNAILQQNIKHPHDLNNLFQSKEIALNTAQKIDSTHDSLILVLKKAPKLINMIREKQPQCVLVGFKLMVGVTQDTLLTTALNLLEKNSCNLVFANDLHHILNLNHKGILVKANGTYISTSTKQNSAELIAAAAIEYLNPQGVSK